MRSSGSVYPRIFAIVVASAIFHLCAADLTGKALYNIVLNQMSPRHISGILYEYPQFTM